jgi:hypothetical protein
MNYELEKTWEEATVSYFKALSHNKINNLFATSGAQEYLQGPIKVLEIVVRPDSKALYPCGEEGRTIHTDWCKSCYWTMKV